MKKTIAIFSSILVGTLTGIAQPMTDIRIVSEDQHSVVLEFTPHIQAEHVSGNQGTIFTRFRFFESQITYNSTGRTDFIRAILLLLPSPQYSLQVLASEYQIKDTVKLLPKPTIKALKDFGFSQSYDDTSFAQTALAPGQNVLAELIRVGETSIGCVGTLLLHPVQAIDKEKVKIYSRIVVRLDFTNAFPTGLVSSCLLRGNLPQKAQLAKMAKVSSRQSIKEDSPLAKGEWYRIEVTETGMYKLDYNYFHSLNISISDINSIRLYGNGGLVIPDNNTSPRPNTLLEIPRLVIDKNSNGIFDPDDYVVFYGRGVRGWLYKGGNTFQHYINPYTETNCYFFTVTQGHGKQMDTLSASAVSPPAFQPVSFQEKLFIEEEKYNLINSGRRWVGKLFTGADAGTYNNSLPGLVASSPIRYRFKFLHRSATFDYLDVFDENGQLLSGGSIEMGAIDLVNSSRFANEVNLNASRAGGVPNDASVVKIQVRSSNQDAKTWMDWLEIYYQRRFEAVNDTLIFTSPDVTGLIQYDISNFSSDIRAFDVTDHSNVKELKYYSAVPSVCTIQLQQTGGSVREIAVVGKTGFKIPATATKIENTINLHNVLSQYDFIIISPPEFLSEANRLKAHRESQSDPLNTLVVDINQIYSEFSGGIPDILAIREFLRYTRANWMSPPQYVLLFGWGHFDYKNIITNKRNWIPAYETEESLDEIYSYPTDDKFVMLGFDTVYSMAIGRLPARSLQEASITVNKIISYETTAPIDSWRNIFTFVADDGITSLGDDGTQYTTPTEELAETYTPKSYEKKKIYIVEYPTVNSASGRRKPSANRAIVDAINQGTLLTNFIGHGNEQLWAHEYIFTRDDDLPKLLNRERLTFVIAATCSFGKYDDPGILSGGEQLVTMEQGGAIGSLVTSRAVYNDRNIAFNNSFFSYLLTKDGAGRNPRLGDAVRYAKPIVAINDYAGNTQKFHLFGDPTLRLLMPKNVASVDSVNGRSTSSIVAMKSLGHVPIQGAMKLNNGTPMISFQGKGTLQVFDSQREVVIHDGNYDFRFKVNGSLLYRGGVSINNGQFETTIPIPKDVTIGNQSRGNQSRISMYAWNDATDGAGYTENVLINGIDATAAIDTVGPQISIYLDDLNFRPGDVVKSSPTMIVRLNDENGINTSTAGVGHQLSATISNPERTFDLSNYYQSDFDTYKSGEVRYQLRGLSEGRYTLRIKAWDVYNNSSEAETYFEVSLADDLTMSNVVNYPNPFSNSTTFTFQRNVIDPINVEVKIFSIAGRLIRKMSEQNITDRSVRIPWDGRDNDGASLANGIYLYKLIARSQNGQHTSETIGKLAVVR